MKKIVVKLIQRLLYISGLNPSNKDTLLNCYIRRFLVLISITYSFCTITLFVYHSPSKIITAWPGAFYALIGIILHIFMYMNESSIKYVFNSTINNLFSYTDEDHYSVKYNGYVSEKKSTKIYLLVLLYRLMVTATYSVPLLMNYFLVGTINFKLYPQWVPWTLESTLNKTLTNIIQVPGFFYITTSALFIYLYYTFVMIEFHRQHKKLKYAIETLSERSHQKVLSMKTGGYLAQKMVQEHRQECYDIAFRYNIIECICHHQVLIRLFQKFKILYNFEYSLQLIHGLSSLTCILLAVVRGNDSVQLYLQTIAQSWILVSGLFFRCVVGEQFSEMNLEIQNTLFHNLNWYDQSIKNKKLILIFHCVACQPYKLRGFWIFPASYKTFSSLIRSSYSYFNVLRTST